jgi:hypothetical protein
MSYGVWGGGREPSRDQLSANERRPAELKVISLLDGGGGAGEEATVKKKKVSQEFRIVILSICASFFPFQKNWDKNPGIGLKPVFIGNLKGQSHEMFKALFKYGLIDLDQERNR